LNILNYSSRSICLGRKLESYSETTGVVGRRRYSIARGQAPQALTESFVGLAQIKGGRGCGRVCIYYYWHWLFFLDLIDDFHVAGNCSYGERARFVFWKVQVEVFLYLKVVSWMHDSGGTR
jgi:hypothetical protein